MLPTPLCAGRGGRSTLPAGLSTNLPGVDRGPTVRDLKIVRAFDDILDLAAARHGGRDVVLRASANHHAADLDRVSDDRILAQMTKCVFQSGFNWKVVETKWDGFEAAFDGFDPHRVAFYADEDLDRLVSDERIVRNGQKIKATVENARFVVETAKAHGGFGAFLASWPADDQIGLMTLLHKNGARLGGATAQYFLRFIGWDAWIASKDVCAALRRDGVIDKPEATTKSALAAVQSAVNALAKDAGAPRAQISRILAMSVG